MGCAHQTQIMKRHVDTFDVQHNSMSGEYEVCDPAIGAWKCQQPTTKTVLAAVNRHCIERHTDAGVFMIEPVASISFGQNNAVNIKAYDRQKLGLAVQPFLEKPLVVIGFSDGLGSSAAKEGIAQKRAQVVRDELVKLGFKKNQVVTESVGDKCLSTALKNNRRAVIFSI